MINKQELREAIAYILDENNHYGLKFIQPDILNSKEFMQKLYRKSLYLFHWLPKYVSDKELWNTVLAEQEKIKLGNAFNDFCKAAKLIKVNHKIDLDNMTSKENSYFKAFKEMYDMNDTMKKSLYKISDYATYEIGVKMNEGDQFDASAYIAMKEGKSFVNTLTDIAKNTLNYVEEKGYETSD